MTRPRIALLPLALAVAAAAPPGTARSQPESAACIACLAPMAELRASYGDEQWRALLAGEVLTTEERADAADPTAQRGVTASGIVPAAPDPVWAVVTDWPSFPRFLPNVRETQVRRREDSRAWIAQHLRVLVTDIRYGAIWTLDPPRGLARFALDPEFPHDIEGSEGSWQIAPIADGGPTLVRYQARIDVGRLVPATVQDLLTRRSLPRVVQGLRDEVLRRQSAPSP